MDNTCKLQESSAGNSKGGRHINPMLDTRIYDALFPDGAVRQYLANSIVENMYSQVDEEENTMGALRYDHRSQKG